MTKPTIKKQLITDPDPITHDNIKFNLITEGYAYVDRTVTHYKGNSSNIYVPKTWKDKRVRIILLDP